MNTKLGEHVPADLASAIGSSPDVASGWDKLRLSCQRRYVALVTLAKRLQTRERRIQSVLKMTLDYNRRHHQLRSK